MLLECSDGQSDRRWEIRSISWDPVRGAPRGGVELLQSAAQGFVIECERSLDPCISREGYNSNAVGGKAIEELKRRRFCSMKAIRLNMSKRTSQRQMSSRVPFKKR